MASPCRGQPHQNHHGPPPPPAVPVLRLLSSVVMKPSAACRRRTPLEPPSHPPQNHALSPPTPPLPPSYAPRPAPPTRVHHSWHLCQARHVLQGQVLEVRLPNAQELGQQRHPHVEQLRLLQRDGHRHRLKHNGVNRVVLVHVFHRLGAWRGGQQGSGGGAQVRGGGGRHRPGGGAGPCTAGAAAERPLVVPAPRACPLLLSSSRAGLMPRCHTHFPRANLTPCRDPHLPGCASQPPPACGAQRAPRAAGSTAAHVGT